MTNANKYEILKKQKKKDELLKLLTDRGIIFSIDKKRLSSEGYNSIIKTLIFVDEQEKKDLLLSIKMLELYSANKLKKIYTDVLNGDKSDINKKKTDEIISLILNTISEKSKEKFSLSSLSSSSSSVIKRKSTKKKKKYAKESAKKQKVSQNKMALLFKKINKQKLDKLLGYNDIELYEKITNKKINPNTKSGKDLIKKIKNGLSDIRNNKLIDCNEDCKKNKICNKLTGRCVYNDKEAGLFFNNLVSISENQKNINKKDEDQIKATRRIQAFYRNNKKRKQQLLEEKKIKAAKKIQSFFRTNQKKKQVSKSKQNKAAKKIQSFFRTNQKKKQLNNLYVNVENDIIDDEFPRYEAVKKIQTLFRRYKFKKQLNSLIKNKTYLAKKLQALYRGNKSRKQIKQVESLKKKQDEAAKKIQILYRNNKLKKEILSQISELKKKQHKAVTKLQALYRGFKTRKQTKSQKKQVALLKKQKSEAVQKMLNILKKIKQNKSFNNMISIYTNNELVSPSNKQYKEGDFIRENIPTENILNKEQLHKVFKNLDEINLKDILNKNMEDNIISFFGLQ